MTTVLKTALTGRMQEHSLPLDPRLSPMKKPGIACMALPGFYMGLYAQAGVSIARARLAMASIVWSCGVSTRAALYCIKLRRIDCR